MGDEIDLNTYKLQLQQVEAALTSDPINEELLQLKQDLSQVIELTSQLVNAGTVPEPEPEPKEEEEAEIEQAFTKAKSEEKKKSKSRWGEKEPVLPVKPWQVGERCQAPYNGKYYDGKITEIDGDTVSIVFDGYKSVESASLGELKLPANGATTPFVKSSKRELEIKRKEYLKEKKKKKQEKMQEQIETKEKEKKQWQNFSSKAFGKKGFVKKSIFKTPESSDGKLVSAEYLAKMDKYLSSLDMKDSRYNILSYPQVKRLSNLMNETIPIQGRGNFPTLQIKLVGLVVLVKGKLEAAGITVHDVRLNGSVASSVLAVESNIEYNDLDLIFSIELDSPKQYEIVKKVVLDSLLDLLPEGTSKERMSGITLKEAYVSKMVKVTETDRWSLIGLGNNHTKSVELKFVDTMKRKYEFSVDSFHIILDTLFLFYECSKMCMSENFYPTVVGESVYGDFSEALYHLENRLIATKHPEQIRGGGLLKYCNLLVKNYRPAVPEQVKNMERYMCSRFFIDFPDLTQQRTKLVKFLDNHFLGPDIQLKYDYLTILYQVVDESTVCLMGHERRQTLQLIEALSCNVFLPTNNNNSYESTTISNWCNGGGGVMNGDLSMSSQSSSSGVALSNSSSSSCHSSRSSPAPQGSYTASSPGSSSSYPSPAPSSASSNGGGVTVCNYAPPQCHAVVSTSSQSHFTTSPPNYHHKKNHGNSNKNKNKNGNNNNNNNGGQYSPMSASSGGSPQSLSPKPAAAATTVPVNHCGEEWRLVPISWVTLSPAPPPNHQQPPPLVTNQPPTSDSSLTSNQTVTYRQVAVRSLCTLDNSNGGVTCQQPPCVTIATPTTCTMVGPPPSQPPPPPSATVIQTSPPPNHHTVAVTSQNGGTPHLATYEIITTCPPQMLYSNGNYYTAFLKTAVAAGGPTLVAACCTGNGEAGTAVNVTAATPTIMTAQPCYSCSCTCQAASMWTLPPASHQTT